MSLVEKFYRTYYALQKALDIYSVIDKSLVDIGQLTNAISPIPNAYPTKEQKERALKLMQLEGLIIDESEQLDDSPFDPTSRLLNDVERPFSTSSYGDPIVSARHDPEPSVSEVTSMIDELERATQYVYRKAYAKMLRLIVAEAKGELPKGTEQRVINLLGAVNQYIRFI
jgi:hypothetical protein